LLTVIILSLTGFSMEQTNSYPIKKVNGIEYYVYTVQSGNGLYAISRKFGIAPEEISKVNPEIQKGLKSGQKILIPIQKNVQENEDASQRLKNELSLLEEKSFEENQKNLHQQTDNSLPSTTLFLQHKVEKNQTLFGISKKYNVSEEEILKYNPHVSKTLHEGEILFIPINNQTDKIGNQFSNSSSNPSDSTTKSKFQKKNSSTEQSKNTTHIVKPKETLYSISRIYNVSVEDILKLNPDAAPVLKIGAELIIPVATLKVDSVVTPSISTKPSQSILPLEENQQLKSMPIETATNMIRLAFLLPLNQNSTTQQNNTTRFIDFYAGSLLAIKKAKENNYSLEIFTFDTEKSDEKLKEILSKPEMKSVDLIIGPAYSNQISLISDFAKENKINVLIPFSSKVYEISVNPYLLQFNPNDTQIEMDFLMNKVIQKNFRNANLIFLNIPDVSFLDDGYLFMESFKTELQKEHQKFSELDVNNPKQLNNILDFLKKGQKNLIFFNTDNFTLINPYLSDLYRYTRNYDVTLYEEYSWENKNLDKFNGLYVAPFKPEIDSLLLDEYQRTFRQYFDWNVSDSRPRYDLLGYDLLDCFISLLNNFGNNFNEKYKELNYQDGLQSDFHFKKQSEFSGYINDKLYMGERKAK
jgi:LysM repeat protein